MVVYGGVKFDDPFMCLLVEQCRLPWARQRMAAVKGRSALEQQYAVAQINEIVTADLKMWSFCQQYGLDMGKLMCEALVHAVDQALGDGWLSTEEAAGVLRCSTRHVRRLARARHIEARIGPTGTWWCTAASVYGYKRRRRVR